jgi:hypothetical protein
VTCPECGLLDPYNGAGDGIGSCDCARCVCCGGVPYWCDCGRDFDPSRDDPDEPYDHLCNDQACPHRRRRAAARVAVTATPREEYL